MSNDTKGTPRQVKCLLLTLPLSFFFFKRHFFLCKEFDDHMQNPFLLEGRDEEEGEFLIYDQT